LLLKEGGIREVDSLAGVATKGERDCPSSGNPARNTVPVDFYDVKADLQALFTATGGSDSFVFEAPTTPLSCLASGTRSRVLRRVAR